MPTALTRLSWCGALLNKGRIYCLLPEREGKGGSDPQTLNFTATYLPSHSLAVGKLSAHSASK
jgi:hypothetical protein